MKAFLYNLAVTIDAGNVGVPEVDAADGVKGVLNAVYWAAGVAAVIVIIFGGIFYAISGGDSSRTKLAKDSILYAVIGLVVVMMAFVITNFVIGSF